MVDIRPTGRPRAARVYTAAISGDDRESDRTVEGAAGPTHVENLARSAEDGRDDLGITAAEPSHGTHGKLLAGVDELAAPYPVLEVIESDRDQRPRPVATRRRQSAIE